MTEEVRCTEAEFHRKMAADLFNSVWDLLEKPERTRDEEDTMVHAAHASRFHWSKVGAPLNFARGEWQIARVYAVLKRPEPALHHAGRCLELCENHNLGPFDLAFAYEAMARALAAAGRLDEATKSIVLAEETAQNITDEADRRWLLENLATVREAASPEEAAG